MVNTLSSSKPVIAILADMPLGRLFPDEYGKQDLSLTPWIFSLFHFFAEQDQYQIHWITFKKYITEEKNIESENQIIHLLPAPSLALGLITGHYSAKRSIRRVLKVIRPNLLHVWGIEMAYAQACARVKTKKILSYQGSLTAYCQRGPMKLIPHLQAFWERRIAPKYKIITCESPWGKDRILEIAPKSHIQLIEYGVEVPFFEIERELSSSPECLFIGTLYELKGVRYLIEAFKHPSLQHIHLYLIGKGKLRDELEPTSTPNIHWLGSLSRNEVQQRLQSSWCLIHPTLADTSPNVVKEARAIGLPVITTKEGGQTQYVEHKKNGYIVPIKDSQSIREAVLSLTESKEKNISMGLCLREENRKALNMQLTADKFQQLYEEILKN